MGIEIKNIMSDGMDFGSLMEECYKENVTIESYDDKTRFIYGEYHVDMNPTLIPELDQEDVDDFIFDLKAHNNAEIIEDFLIENTKFVFNGYKVVSHPIIPDDDSYIILSEKMAKRLKQSKREKIRKAERSE